MSTTGLLQPDIVTARLRLRRLRPSDAALIGLYTSDAKVARMTSRIPHPLPPGMAEAYVERVLGPGATETAWAIDLGADGGSGLIGVIILKGRGAVAEVGYWLGAAFWGTGYASEAVEAIVAEATRRGLTALTAEVFQDNLASAKVLTRAGFAYEGEGEGHAVARGAMVPTFRYRRDLQRI